MLLRKDSQLRAFTNIEFHEISLTPFAETLPQFPSCLLWHGGGWGWNIGDWVDITHGALHINAQWWFMRKCWRQVKDYTNRWCWVFFPRNLPIFSPLVLVFVCFCQLFLVRSSQMWWFVSKLLLLKSHCAVSWKWLSAVRSVVTRVITLELGRSHTCPQPPATHQPPAALALCILQIWDMLRQNFLLLIQK